jgi:hypothetical protein
MRAGIPPIYRLGDQVAKLRDLYEKLLAGRLSRSQAHAAID